MNKEQLLGELKSKVTGCRKCRLAETRTNVVFGEGDPYSPLMIIGEGPGADEDKTGRPFVGKAGRLLTECLTECGIPRNRVFIANTVKCRACIVGPNTVKNRPPETDEISCCREWLEMQLEIIRPLVILTLGAPAARLMLNRQNIAMTKERGVFYDAPCGIPVIPSLHPSYILRNMYKDGDGGKSLLISDIEVARKRIVEIKKAAKEKPAEKKEAEPFEKYVFEEKDLGF